MVPCIPFDADFNSTYNLLYISSIYKYELFIPDKFKRP